jgi:hypothetical protein
MVKQFLSICESFKFLLIGYLYGIRWERRLVEEVHLNLAAGSAGLASRARYPNDPAFQTRGMAGSATATLSAWSSRVCCKPVCAPVWSAA